jgi:hypothetical protein
MDFQDCKSEPKRARGAWNSADDSGRRVEWTEEDEDPAVDPRQARTPSPIAEGAAGNPIVLADDVDDDDDNSTVAVPSPKPARFPAAAFTPFFPAVPDLPPVNFDDENMLNTFFFKAQEFFKFAKGHYQSPQLHREYLEVEEYYDREVVPRAFPKIAHYLRWACERIMVDCRVCFNVCASSDSHISVAAFFKSY